MGVAIGSLVGAGVEGIGVGVGIPSGREITSSWPTLIKSLEPRELALNSRIWSTGTLYICAMPESVSPSLTVCSITPFGCGVEVARIGIAVGGTGVGVEGTKVGVEVFVGVEVRVGVLVGVEARVDVEVGGAGVEVGAVVLVGISVTCLGAGVQLAIITLNRVTNDKILVFIYNPLYHLVSTRSCRVTFFVLKTEDGNDKYDVKYSQNDAKSTCRFPHS